MQAALYRTIPDSVINILEMHGCHDEDETPSAHRYALKSDRLQTALAKDLKSRLSPPAVGVKVAAMLDQHDNSKNGARFAEGIFCAKTGPSFPFSLPPSLII